MAKSTHWTFVTPNYVVSKKIKGFKTTMQVKSFATKNDVFCGYIKNSSGTGRTFVVEMTSFKKAASTMTSPIMITAISKKTTGKKYGKKTTSIAKKASTRKTISTWTKSAKIHSKNGVKSWAKTYTKRRAA